MRTKSFKGFVISVFFIIGILFTACNPIITAPKEYEVIFNSNDGSEVTKQIIVDGGKVVKPTIPTKEGYVFEGWYEDASFTKKWDFTVNIVTKDITLYAQWKFNPSPSSWFIFDDSSGEIQGLTDSGDGNWKDSIDINKSNIVIPSEINGKSVVKIADEAFLMEETIKSIFISKTITVIEGAPFGGCFSLLDIFVEEDNPVYCSVDGIIFDKRKETIISYPAGKKDTYIIPLTVNTIGYGAFLSNSLEPIDIPENITTIGFAAFAYSLKLKTVTISSNIKKIEEQAFTECYELTTIICKSINPPILEKYAFDENNENIKIKVPAESVETYKKAENWSVYANWIEAL